MTQIEARKIAEWLDAKLFGDSVNSNIEETLCPLCAYRSTNCVSEKLVCTDGIAKEIIKVVIEK